MIIFKFTNENLKIFIDNVYTTTYKNNEGGIGEGYFNCESFLKKIIV